jgi:hypothetical protein
VEVAGPAGYSVVELWTVAVGLIAVFAASLAVLYRLLAEDYGTTAALIGVVGAWAGTSLFYYSAVFPFMAHALSFGLLVTVMGLARELAAGREVNRRLVLLGVSIGAIFLVRPQQAIVAVFLFPIVASVGRTRAIAAWVPGLIAGALLGLAEASTQIAFNFAQLGIVTASGYAAAGEGFNWLTPKLSLVLLGESRGLVVFSPVVVIAAAAYVWFGRSLPGYARVAAGNALAQIYVIAAWWAPEQGDSFGARVWSDNAAAVAVGLAVMIHQASGIWRWVVAGTTLAAVGWTTALLIRYITSP